MSFELLIFMLVGLRLVELNVVGLSVVVGPNGTVVGLPGERPGERPGEWPGEFVVGFVVLPGSLGGVRGV
jgi:hypothetical protein